MRTGGNDTSWRTFHDEVSTRKVLGNARSHNERPNRRTRSQTSWTRATGLFLSDRHTAERYRDERRARFAAQLPRPISLREASRDVSIRNWARSMLARRGAAEARERGLDARQFVRTGRGRLPACKTPSKTLLKERVSVPLRFFLPSERGLNRAAV